MAIATPIHDPLPGRPRSFDRDQALENALTTFWRSGYEATSIEDLTSAMGISRSSLYGCFGSKRDILLEVLCHYSTTRLARFTDMAAQQGKSAVRPLLLALSDPDGGLHGCLLVNCITELAPHDPEIASLGQAHIARLEAVLASKLDEMGAADVRQTATALVAIALGTLTLRKTGFTAAKIEIVLEHADALITSKA